MIDSTGKVWSLSYEATTFVTLRVELNSVIQHIIADTVAGATIGAGAGALIGSLIPGAGTVRGAAAGAGVGATLGFIYSVSYIVYCGMGYWGDPNGGREMKLKSIAIYLISLFLLYESSGIEVALTLASVSLSVMYVWTTILWMMQGKREFHRDLPDVFLVTNITIILISALIVGVTLAALLLAILLALSGFILLAQHGLRKEPPAKNAEVRLRWFGILLLGFFSMNPLMEGIFTQNWIEVVAMAMLVFGGYLMFEDLRRSVVGIGNDREGTTVKFRTSDSD